MEALENLIKQATENFALDFMNKQEALERRTIERINVLSDQIRMITDLFKSSIPQPRSEIKQPQPQSYQQVLCTGTSPMSNNAFPCNLCGHSFESKQVLRNHRKNHHPT